MVWKLKRRISAIAATGGIAVVALAAGALMLGGGAGAATAESVSPGAWGGSPADVERAYKTANWRTLPQSMDGLEPQPSLIFPKGTTYQDAVNLLYEGEMRGEIPEGAILADPLPSHIVASGETQDRGLALSLTAPFGYDVKSTRVLPVMWMLPASTTNEELRKLLREASERGVGVPRGAIVDPPPLGQCQVENLEVEEEC